MSVNYGTPHAVDIPVTDMDDVEDDLFGETPDKNHDFLQSMDYEHAEPGLISKVKNSVSNLFGSRNGTNSYEMVDTFSVGDSSYHDEEEAEEPQPGFDVRDYKIRLLTSRMQKMLVTGVFVIVSLVAVILYLSSRGGSGLGLSPAIKTILSNSTHEFHPTTIVVSLDGFHPHYINPRTTPTMHNMLLNDFGAPYMTPSFPSSTFPNHWTLVTGLYPSEHGIVGNTFFDTKLNKQFINTNPKVGGLDPEFWKGGEPVWTTAKRQGLNAAVHMWPGSEVRGIGPETDFDRYNGSELLSSKVARVMEWLDRDDITKRPELILTYVPTVDQVGHKVGIVGEELNDAVKYVDDFVALMKQELSLRNLDNIANLIIVSDHGMAPTSNERLLYLDELVDLAKIEHIDGWPLFGLRPFGEYSVDEIVQELRGNFDKVDENIRSHYHIYKKEEFPKEWQLGGEPNEHNFNYRLAPIWIIPDVGYSVTTKKQMEDNGGEYKPKGVHAYNNTELLMRATFLGSGPYFNQRLRKSKKVLPFPNTEVYNIICESLDLVPAPNNGSSSGYVISGSKELPDDWTDPLEYPNVPFPVEHIVKDATYDLLWKKKKADNPKTISVSTNNEPLQSLVSQESSLSIDPNTYPKPTDFNDHDSSDSEAEEEVQKEIDDFIGGLIVGIGGAIEGLSDSMGNVADGLGGWLDKLLGNTKENSDK